MEKAANTEMSKEEKDAYVKTGKLQREQIKKGYGRIQEKCKEIRQNFSSALINGRRSGSGKIVFEHYDRLIKIYGGSVSSESLVTGVDTDTFNCLNQTEESEFGSTPKTNAVDLFATDISSAETNENMTHIIPALSATTPVANKRKAKDACVKLIDNKRKNMERNLSAAQRDQLLLKESKEEMGFKKEMADIMRESSRNTATAITQMTTAIENIGTGLSRSIEMLATVFSQQQQCPPQPTRFNNFNSYIQPWLGQQDYSQMSRQQEMQNNGFVQHEEHRQ